MNTYESLQHDLTDARLSVDTAIELLSSIEQDQMPRNPAIQALVGQLTTVRHELEDAYRRLGEVQHGIVG